MYAAQNLLTVC